MITFGHVLLKICHMELIQIKSFEELIQQFKKILSNIPFQPENKGAPIQILGILAA